MRLSAAPPQRIEGFDISNISGTFAVASIMRFKTDDPTARTIAVSNQKCRRPDASRAFMEVVRRRHAAVE